ncbi:Hypothetical protein GSB_155023, partial [Giardia duodenalis]
VTPRLWSCTCRWPGVRLWFWSEVAVRLTSSSALNSPTGGGTRRSCRASWSWSALSRAVYIVVQGPGRASPSPPAPRQSAGRTSGGSASLLCRVTGACTRRRLKYVSPAEPAPSTDGPPGPRPRVDVEGGPDPPQLLVEEAGHEQAEPSFSLGRPGSRRLSQPLREPVEPPVVTPAGWSPRGVRTHRRARTARAGRALAGGRGARDLPQALCPATARCRIPRTRWGWSIGLPALSSGVTLLLRGGGVAWASVLVVSAAASEEPCVSALCVQVLGFETPPPDDHS